jgi:hypothetical protein
MGATLMNTRDLAQEIKPNWKIGLRVWWAFAWRSGLLTYASTFLLDFCLDFMGVSGTVEALLSFLVVVWVQIIVCQNVLDRHFGGFRIAVLRG